MKRKLMRLFFKDEDGLGVLTTFGLVFSGVTFIILLNLMGWLLGGF